MKKIFENYRLFLVENTEQLLIEARETDSLKRVVKGIGKAEDPQGKVADLLTAHMEVILNSDPSGNQKYALWAAKALNTHAHNMIKNTKGDGTPVHDYTDSVLGHLPIAYHNISQRLEKYHKLSQRNLIEKDINKFNSWLDFKTAVDIAWNEVEKRERMKAMEKQAKRETDVITTEEDYMIVRPRTPEGSCYFGQGTKWCISATQSQNYFNQYTGEGKGFYFVFFHHLPQDHDNKKLALVYEAGYDEPSEVYDRPDDEIGADGLRDAVELNVLMKGFWKSLPDKKSVKKILNKKQDELLDIAEKHRHELALFRDRDTSEGTTEVLTTSLRNLGIEITEVEEVEEAFEELVSDQLYDIIGASSHHWDENPAGPTEEEYQVIEDEHDLQHFYVSREEMDEGRMYWDAGTTFRFDDVDDLVEDAVDTDVLRDFVDSALDAHYIYGEVEDGSYGGEIQIYVRINPDHGEHEGIEGFSSFMETVASADKEWQNVYDDVIDKMKEAGWIPGESMKALLEKFNEMKFQNFDVEMEDGNVQMSSRLRVKILLPDELQTGRAKVSSMSGQTRGAMAEDPRPLINSRLFGHLKNVEYSQEIGSQIISRLKDVLERGMKIIASQMKLPLKEEKTPLIIPEFNIQFGALGPVKQGSYLSGGGRTDYDVSDKFTYWLDVVIEGEETEEEVMMIQKFLRMIDKEEFFEKIRQYTEGLVNNQIQKQIMPRIRRELADTRSQEKTVDELANIFEKWRRFIK